MHILCAVLLLTIVTVVQSSPDLDQEWGDWKTKHQKMYNNQSEVFYRRTMWQKSRDLVTRHNLEASAGTHSFTLDLNHLADMTEEEVNERLNGLKAEETFSSLNWTSREGNNVTTIPQSIDWREEGMVSPVQNQGLCGSCWAFSAVGALEGQMKRRTGVLVALSPQNLLDCSSSEGNHGCRGGYISKSYNYITRNGGIDSEKYYPYEHKVGKCRYSVKGRAGYCSGSHILARGDEKSLQSVVSTVGPIAVGINAMLRSFHLYRGGVYNPAGCNPKITNHAVLIVGYGSDRGQDYWLVKNSWGTAWGEGGFIRMARNKKNLCGIANFAVYPTL